MKLLKSILFTLAASSCVTAQLSEIKIGKHATTIPKVCESVVPASLEGQLDVPALVKEAICKGAGDMMIEYTYVLTIVRREKKKASIEEKAWTYEVFIPTLKSGIRTKGILVLTSRDGVAVPPDELEKARVQAAHRLEDEEEKISRQRAPSKTKIAPATGMQPMGMYVRSNRGGSVLLDVSTFLANGELTLLRRETQNGRDTLVFRFVPRPDAQFKENERYIAQLTGEISIDVSDRIMTSLVAWPLSSTGEQAGAQKERPPAVSLQMLRLKTGVWLAAATRINAVDYPQLFSGDDVDVKATYSNYIRFSTEVKDVNVDAPEPEPRRVN
ncbi:MAG TPA: hypothetical protein VIT88_02915 [Pyrinomonadaceae bacterium]